MQLSVKIKTRYKISLLNVHSWFLMFRHSFNAVSTNFSYNFEQNKSRSKIKEASNRNRTCGLKDHNLLLYQLSYTRLFTSCFLNWVKKTIQIKIKRNIWNPYTYQVLARTAGYLKIELLKLKWRKYSDTNNPFVANSSL